MDTLIKNIEKEEVEKLHFPADDVLFLKEEKQQRDLSLNNALILGNTEHNKHTILFEDVEGVKKVTTTIWGITDKEIILKQNIVIPIHRIKQIF